MNTRRAKPGTCDRPPPGWYCSKAAGHEGSCPTWPGRLHRLRYALHALRRSP